jgi:SAM-dependent methyltransferase
VQGDAEALPFASGSFDALVCVDGFSVETSRLMAEAARVLAPGATFAFLLSVPGISSQSLAEAIATAEFERAAGEDLTDAALVTLGRLQGAYQAQRRSLRREIGDALYHGLWQEVRRLRTEMSSGRMDRRLIYGRR